MKGAIILILVLAVLVSAVSVVATQHSSRAVFMEIEQLKKKRDLLNEEWGRLQIEQGTWSMDDRIERVVNEELDMQAPNNGSRVFLVPMNTDVRKWFVLVLFAIAAVAVASRVFYLQILNKDFLISEGNARSIRSVAIPAYRGMITDRNGEPLAVSTPVASVWAAPGKALDSGKDLRQLAGLLNTPVEQLRQLLSARRDRDFVYLKRHVPPDTARRVRALEDTGR